ncbi:Fc.00g062850.m01.CDS01 [Cosmosporella sp. VM-42]
MPAANKPKLGKLTTPLTATFPSEITSATMSATPLSAISFNFKPDPDFIKTPISPPMAYTDFLSKAMSLNSPAMASGETTPDSLPDSAKSEQSECCCKSERSSPTTSTSSASIKGSSPPATAPIVPPSPFTSSLPPMSAPPNAASFPSLKVPPSPAISHIDSPLSATAARSPFSARSVHSVFDWDAALKARFAEKKQKKPSRTSVRHIREVVTRTVTYTPRMAPAPKGKRRKVE